MSELSISRKLSSVCICIPPAALKIKYHKTSSTVVRGIFIYHVWDFSSHAIELYLPLPCFLPSWSSLIPLFLQLCDVHSPVDSSPSPAALPHPPLLHLMNISQASRDSPPPLSSYSQTPSVLSVPIASQDDSIIVLGKVHLMRPAYHMKCVFV